MSPPRVSPMGVFSNLAVLALKGVSAAVGLKEGGEAVADLLTQRFSDHSQRLLIALNTANEQAWKALEIALAGDSLLNRAEDKALAHQVRLVLDAMPFPELSGKQAYRQECLKELRAARKAKALTAGTLEPRQLAQQTADFARFSDPTSLPAAEWRLVAGMAGQLKEAGYGKLAWLPVMGKEPGRHVF